VYAFTSVGVRCNGFMDQGFCYPMVDIFLKTLLTSREFLEAAFRRTSAYPLQRTPTLVIAYTHLMNFGTCKGLSIAIGCQIDYAQVYTQRIMCLSQFR